MSHLFPNACQPIYFTEGEMLFTGTTQYEIGRNKASMTMQVVILNQ